MRNPRDLFAEISTGNVTYRECQNLPIVAIYGDIANDEFRSLLAHMDVDIVASESDVVGARQLEFRLYSIPKFYVNVTIRYLFGLQLLWFLKTMVSVINTTIRMMGYDVNGVSLRL